MAVLYMMEAFPESQRVIGLLLGFLTLQIGAPLSRIISENLLEIGLWRGLQFVDIGLAVLSVAAINMVRPVPAPRVRALNRGDAVAFPLYAISLGLFSVVLTQGRAHWWTDANWLGICLAIAIACAGMYILIELHRDEPMLDLRWLARPFMIRFIIATLFMGTLLGRSFNGAELVLVASLSIAASFATLGVTGLAALSPLAAVLRPFGLSYELAVPLMVIVDPIANMVRVMLNVAGNCAIPAMAARSSTESGSAKAAPVPAE